MVVFLFLTKGNALINEEGAGFKTSTGSSLHGPVPGSDFVPVRLDQCSVIYLYKVQNFTWLHCILALPYPVV